MANLTDKQREVILAMLGPDREQLVVLLLAARTGETDAQKLVKQGVNADALAKYEELAAMTYGEKEFGEAWKLGFRSGAKGAKPADT